MVSRRSSQPFSRRSAKTHHTFVAFLLIASFGILFAGCTGKETTDQKEEFSFTAEDIAKFHELAQQNDTGSVLSTGDSPLLSVGSGALTASGPTILDLSMIGTYDAIRTGPGGTGADEYHVVNEFLNVRSTASVTAPLVVRLNRGDALTLLSFIDGTWAKVQLRDNREGYVAQRYIAKLITEDRLEQEKAKYKGMYFVNYAFVNVRKSADSESEKIGELPGQSFIKPISIDAQWARVPFGGKEGYVSSKYLAPFVPNFLVRQDAFTLPILQYNISNAATITALQTHVSKLKEAGYRIITLSAFRDFLLRQEQKDIRLEPKTVVLTISGVTPSTVKTMSDALMQSGINATVFLNTKDLGLTGITEKVVITLVANGLDVQSGGHTGDDLRALTNAQVELELKQSRQLLEQYAHKTVFAIGYPEGGVNDRVATFASQLGYLFGVGSAPEILFTRAQMLRLPSITVTANESADDVLKIVSGK